MSHLLLDDNYLVLSSIESYEDSSLQVYCYTSDLLDWLRDIALAPPGDVPEYPDDPDDSDPIYLSEDDPGYIFTFRMPKAKYGMVPNSNVKILDIRATFPAVPHRPSPFLLDRASTILSVSFSVENQRRQLQSSFVLLIPLSILRSHVDRVRSLIARGIWRDRDRHVKWLDWGSAGTLLLTSVHPPSGNPPPNNHSAICVPYGSRYPILLSDTRDATSGDVLILDLHPHVGRQAPPSPQTDKVEDESVIERIVAEPDPPSTVLPMQMNAPFAATRKFHVEFPADTRPTHVVMNHDGFSISVRDFLSHRRKLSCH